MAILRCTQKLLRQMRAAPLSDEGEPANRLGDWYANALNIGRLRLVLCVSERSLLPVILQAREYRTLPTRLLPEVRWLLASIGVPSAVAVAEVSAMEPMSVGKTRSRTVLGSMNQMLLDAYYHLTDPRHVPELRATSLHLCTAIYSQLGHGRWDYGSPTEATLQILLKEGGGERAGA
jgi:hypothetical protein